MLQTLAQLVVEIVVPGEVHGAGNVGALIESGVDADLDHTHVGAVQVLRQPLGSDQRTGGGASGGRRIGKGGAGQRGQQHAAAHTDCKGPQAEGRNCRCHGGPCKVQKGGLSHLRSGRHLQLNVGARMVSDK
ncbi:hypothetical protein D3C71_1762900 [compost metagenome]